MDSLLGLRTATVTATAAEGPAKLAVEAQRLPKVACRLARTRRRRGCRRPVLVIVCACVRVPANVCARVWLCSPRPSLLPSSRLLARSFLTRHPAAVQRDPANSSSSTPRLVIVPLGVARGGVGRTRHFPRRFTLALLPLSLPLRWSCSGETATVLRRERSWRIAVSLRCVWTPNSSLHARNPERFS